MQASQHGNTDATERLSALSQPAPQALSRQEHNNLTETTLVRKRTQAKQRSDARGPVGGQRHGGRPNSQEVVANIRKNSVVRRPGPTGPSAGPDQPSADMYPIDEGYPQRRPPQQVPFGNSDGGGAGGFGYRPPPQPAGVGAGASGYSPPSQPQAFLPRGSSPAPGGYPSPRIPSQQVQQQYGQPQGRRPSQPSVGPAPGAPGRRPQAASGSGPGPVSEPPPRPIPAKGPSTFQEMGFESQKLEEKDCVIM